MSPHKARLLETHRIRWEPGLNDPSVFGWLAVAGYAAVAVLAWRASRRTEARFDRAFWLVVAAATALLAVNKQLDLHVLVTDLGRHWAVQNDLYQQRRAIQVGFIAALALAGGGLALALAAATRARDASVRLALAGMALCGGYILVRAASFHHLDAVMRSVGRGWLSVIELAGIAMAALAAWRYPATR